MSLPLFSSWPIFFKRLPLPLVNMLRECMPCSYLISSISPVCNKISVLVVINLTNENTFNLIWRDISDYKTGHNKCRIRRGFSVYSLQILPIQSANCISFHLKSTLLEGNISMCNNGYNVVGYNHTHTACRLTSWICLFSLFWMNLFPFETIETRSSERFGDCLSFSTGQLVFGKSPTGQLVT